MVGQRLSQKKIAFLATDMVERAELTGPWEGLKAQGAALTLVSPNDTSIQMFEHYDKADTFDVDVKVDDATADDYDALVLPGGVGNPDTLRMNPRAVAFVRSFFDRGKPAGVICHAPWLLIEADVVSGRTLTSWPSLATDLKNAGAHWLDQPVVVDGNLVTSRRPDDIPDHFVPNLVDVFSR
ncbi:type 1 glutamine amidotransferase domain-containing protein [Mycobacterium sp. Marseille-P9652]|uniref:type 1 glutamine amidotransferase domain-containing protein n=1 Tax=Mycobacterium sp. Marseille-P9652 TaxID=2654950 RepID=UPI0012E72594|nr:type 1 glutamine amidotransferase domain-containing protein [Mycobacterium sp. Marseille-P9652]